MDKVSRETEAPNRRSRLVIAGWTLHEGRHRLEKDENSVKLEPKTTELLGYLARRPGEPLSREELLREVWPDVIVSDEALTNAINKIRRAFDDDRQNPKVIETIPKMGYRLIAYVDPPKMGPEEGSILHEVSGHATSRDELCVQGKVIPSVPMSGIWRLPWASVIRVLMIVGLLLSVGFYLLKLTSTDHNLTVEHSLLEDSGKLYLAVLPFANLSDDSEQEFFVDGITEDLITDLSKVSGMNVIARNSVFAYKGMAPKPQDVALHMGASHVLEGSVRKATDQVRINVALIDTSSGLNLWAERFDGSLKDVFKLQDYVTRRVVSALAIKLTQKEQDALARDRTANVEALQHYFIGRAYYGSASKQENEASRKMFRRAIDLDPSYGQAYAALGLTYLDDWRRGWSENPEKVINKSVTLAQKAITVDDTVPEAHFALGYIHLYAKGQHDRAIEEAKTALALNPNHVSGYALLSSAYFFSGFPEKALPLDRKAIQLDPGSSFLYHVHLGRSYYFQGRYQKALNAFKQAEERNYNYIPNHLWLAATYSQLDRPDDAEWEADQVLTLDPDFSIQRWVTRRPYKNSKHREQLLDGLRKAGLTY